MIFNTASVCRGWVYTSSDLVFDKGTHEALSWCCHCLSAGRGNPSFVSEGNSTNSRNLNSKTKNSTQKPKPSQKEHTDGDELGISQASRLLPRPPETPHFTGSAVKCLPGLSITATWAAVQCSETANSGDCYLSAQPQRITRSLWLHVGFVPVHHMMPIWHGWNRGESHFTPFTHLVEYKMKMTSG